jgi:hypothetical protein
VLAVPSILGEALKAAQERIAVLEAALFRAIRLIHYGEAGPEHRSVQAGQLIIRCTDLPCPELNTAYQPATAAQGGGSQ